ncbi:unnamed protein product [Allacma fusca]|uniref:Uncharacterized protein n=1 Tax=Allacma fusca TaxID=39272 RepID=A0A8J2P0P2_9HEXA|nr:unnamed protein product [Allacma fusca]
MEINHAFGKYGVGCKSVMCPSCHPLKEKERETTYYLLHVCTHIGKLEFKNLTSIPTMLDIHSTPKEELEEGEIPDFEEEKIKREGPAPMNLKISSVKSLTKETKSETMKKGPNVAPWLKFSSSSSKSIDTERFEIFPDTSVLKEETQTIETYEQRVREVIKFKSENTVTIRKTCVDLTWSSSDEKRTETKIQRCSKRKTAAKARQRIKKQLSKENKDDKDREDTEVIIAGIFDPRKNPNARKVKINRRFDIDYVP